MRQHFWAPSLFDGFWEVFGSHTPTPSHPLGPGGRGSCLQLLGGQPHQFSYQIWLFLYTFLRVQAHNLIVVVAATAASSLMGVIK